MLQKVTEKTDENWDETPTMRLSSKEWGVAREDFTNKNGHSTNSNGDYSKQEPEHRVHPCKCCIHVSAAGWQTLSFRLKKIGKMGL